MPRNLIQLLATIQELPMARQRIQMEAVILAMMAVLWAGVAAQSSSSCTNAIISMSSCLNYITGNSLTPSSGCCSQFANVVRSQPQCLCQLLSGGGSTLGININQTRALALPRACNVQTPPISRWASCFSISFSIYFPNCDNCFPNCDNCFPSRVTSIMNYKHLSVYSHSILVVIQDCNHPFLFTFSKA